MTHKSLLLLILEQLNDELVSLADKTDLARKLIQLYKKELRQIGKNPTKDGLLDLVRRCDEYLSIVKKGRVK